MAATRPGILALLAWAAVLLAGVVGLVVLSSAWTEGGLIAPGAASSGSATPGLIAALLLPALLVLAVGLVLSRRFGRIEFTPPPLAVGAEGPSAP